MTARWQLGVLFVCGATWLAAQSATTSKPILFVHGFCDTADSWTSLETQVISSLTGPNSGFGYSNANPVVLYYDGNAVRQYPSAGQLLPIDSTTRFFSIEFYAAGAFPSSASGAIDATRVANVSILNKADELSHVVHNITQLTGTPNVVIVGHSMGGLVARAYMENLASPYVGLCSPSNNYTQCAPGTTSYAHDIAELITLDTPHGGAIAANYLSLNPFPAPCNFADTTDLQELEEGSTLLSWLRQDVAQLQQPVTIVSIVSYIDTLDGDGVVSEAEQSFVGNISASSLRPTYYDLPNVFDALPRSLLKN